MFIVCFFSVVSLLSGVLAYYYSGYKRERLKNDLLTQIIEEWRAGCNGEEAD